MNRYFEIGNRFSLDGANGEYEVKEIVGKGASCIVYRTTFTNKSGVVTEHLLKEYNPSRLNVIRDDNKFLSVPEEELSDFKSGMERFVSGYQLQLEIRQKIREVTNSTSNIQEVYSDFSTKYIDMTLFHGETYGNVQEKSLYDLLRRAKAITQVIGSYHKAGYLHLDLKPDNIFTIPETCELVMLFDFDSVTEKSQLMNRTGLSYTQSWAAPEQISLAQKKKICEATDLFPIGEMIFYQMFSRHSKSEEKWSFCDYEFDLEAPIFKNVNPKVFQLLTELLHKTICVSVKERYQTADELLEKLDELIKLADPKEPFLVGTAVAPEAFFIGRDTELAEIHTQLQKNHTLFLSGIGGIGKSELAKNYAKQYADNYDTVLFSTYNGSWLMLINDDTNIHIANFERFSEEKEQDYYRRKIRKLKELCNKRTLFIIDNLDADEFEDEAQEQWENILELGCKLLITTRLREWSYPILDIGTFSDTEHLIQLFDQYCKIENDADMAAVLEIIDYVSGHTLTVELIAKQTKTGFSAPAKILEKLQERGIAQSGKERVVSDKDNAQSRKTAFDHIAALFDIADLDEQEKYVLANMSLIPPDGIDAKLFAEWCELEDFESVNRLVGNGWLDRADDVIKMHPVVGEVISCNFHQIDSLCQKYMKAIGTIVYNLHKSLSHSTTSIQTKQEYSHLLQFVANTIYKRNILSLLTMDILLITAREISDFGKFIDAEKYLKKVLEFRKQQFGENSDKTAQIYSDLGNLYRKYGKFDKAAKQYCKSAQIDKNLYGNESFEYAIDLKDLGLLYNCKGELALTEKLLLKAKEIYAINISDENYAMTKLNMYLGDFYISCGKYDMAKDLLLDVLRKEESEEHNTYIVHFQLGTCYREMEDYEKAVFHAKAAVKMALNEYSENHISVAPCYSCLGLAYLLNDDFSKAQSNLEKALKIRQYYYGDEHWKTAESYYRMGLLYEKLGKYQTAKDCFQKAFELRELLFGEENKDTIDAKEKKDAMEKLMCK